MYGKFCLSVFCLSVCFLSFTNTCLCFCPRHLLHSFLQRHWSPAAALALHMLWIRHGYWPFLLISFEVLNDSGGSRGREGYHSVGGSIEGMNGYEELVRWRGREPGATCSTPLSRNSHNAPGFTSSSSLRPGRRPKGNPNLCRLVHKWQTMFILSCLVYFTHS